MTDKPKDLVISVELAQAVTNYLAKRPYEEVFILIDRLTKLEPLMNLQNHAKGE